MFGVDEVMQHAAVEQVSSADSPDTAAPALMRV